MTEDGAVAIDVLVNDSDQEDDRSALTLRVTASPRRGSATVNEPANVGERRTITYTPNENYHGSDVFTYEVRDAGSPSLSRTATVSVEVDEVNDPPTFKSAATTRSVSQSATGGAKVGAPVTASDVDDNDTLTYSLSGSEARFFAIGARSGQITVGDGVTFDIATTKDTYTVTVHADDTSFERATVEVTITVTSGPTTPPITGGGGGGGGDPVVVVEIDGPSFAAADTEAVFTAAVSDGTTISALSWTVTGPRRVRRDRQRGAFFLRGARRRHLHAQRHHRGHRWGDPHRPRHTHRVRRHHPHTSSPTRSSGSPRRASPEAAPSLTPSVPAAR